MSKHKYFHFIFLLTALIAVSCSNHKTPLFKKDKTSLAEKENTLLVFVGEKIEVKELPQDEGAMDGKYYGKYKVLQSVYGNYSLDTIEFIAYDHYGDPDFSKYKNVLLFVSERRGKYIHEKYLFYDVYKTKDNRWAGPYSVRHLGRDNKREDGISAVKIDFEEDVSFPFSLIENKKEIPCLFPEPYYKLESDRAIAVYGNYIEELFKIEKHGVLTARGLFGKGKPGELAVPETEIAEIKMIEEPSAKDRKVFNLFWKNLMKQPDSFIYVQLNNLSIQPSDLNERIKRIFSTKAIEEFKKEDYRYYVSSYVTTEGSVFQVSKVVDTINTIEIRVKVSFLKSKSGLTLSGIEEEKKSICW